jgi:hypothetical protein
LQRCNSRRAGIAGQDRRRSEEGDGMDIRGIDIAQIVDLGTQVANCGAIRALEQVADGTYEYTVAIVVIAKNSPLLP